MASEILSEDLKKYSQLTDLVTNLLKNLKGEKSKKTINTDYIIALKNINDFERGILKKEEPSRSMSYVRLVNLLREETNNGFEKVLQEAEN